MSGDTTVAARAALGAASGRRGASREGDELAPGRTVLRRIGGGRRYEALLVWDEHRLAMLVAKVLRPDCATDPHALRDLAREAALLERLAHPVLVRSFGAVPDGRFPHLLLEHLEGPTLDELIARDGALALEQVLPLALHVASALHYLAAEGVVHLDVKPSNVVMGAPPRLIDLSVARTLAEAAAVRAPIGTDAYMAPEQRAARVRARPARRRLGPRRDRPRRADRRAHGAPSDAARGARCPRAARRARVRSPAARPRRCATSSRPGSTPIPASRPDRARVRRGARAAGRRAAAAAHARTPLVTLCGGWTAAPRSPPERCSARSSSSPCTSGAGSSTGTTARACTRTRRGCSPTAGTSMATSSSRSRRGSSSSARARWRSTTR